MMGILAPAEVSLYRRLNTLTLKVPSENGCYYLYYKYFVQEGGSNVKSLLFSCAGDLYLYNKYIVLERNV